ncbi:MAG: RsmD family RNA methyltransferase [Propionibacteriaceae bacterium]
MSRVIGGRFRGQRLAAPPGDRTRPTSDRVREAVFSSLVSWLGTGDLPGDEALAGVGFLDLYGGSGGVAIEAASRGAAPVRLVERDAKVAAVARRNAGHVSAAVQVTTAPVAAFLSGSADVPYDIVWLDPPYAVGDEELSAAVTSVVEHGWLAPDGLVVVERSSRTPDPVLPPRLDDVWYRRYGETTIHYATRKAAP